MEYIVGYFRTKESREKYVAQLGKDVKVRRLGKGKRRYIKFWSENTPPCDKTIVSQPKLFEDEC